MSSIKSIFTSIIKNDRKMLCDILKSLDFGNDDVYSQLLTSTIPELPKEFKMNSKPKKEKSDKPRRVSGYILFSNDFRSKAKENGKTGNPKDSIREAGNAWNNLDSETKTSWNELSNSKFEESVNLYKETHPDYNPNIKSSKFVKEKIYIPRMKSPYVIYVSHVSKSGEVKKGVNLMTFASSKWTKLEKEEKLPFEEESNETKKEANKFRNFMDSIKNKLIEEGIEDNKKSIELAAAKMWNTFTDEEKNKNNDFIDKTNQNKVKVPNVRNDT